MKNMPQRLQHEVPSWVSPGSLFHIRIRAERRSNSLIEPSVGDSLLRSARHYHQIQRWYCGLFLLMPDHLHALLAFRSGIAMSEVIGAWKSFLAKNLPLSWQDGYFDHRIRSTREWEETEVYIRMNPVVKGLCSTPAEWPWVISGHELASEE